MSGGEGTFEELAREMEGDRRLAPFGNTCALICGLFISLATASNQESSRVQIKICSDGNEIMTLDPCSEHLLHKDEVQNSVLLCFKAFFQFIWRVARKHIHTLLTSERELLSSHGFTQNQLTLWKYPSMDKMAELTGHTSRVLFMAQSPDGCTVASAAGDETLRFWNVFGTPEAPKTAVKTFHTGMFNSYNHIR